jgi:ABC-2 type transport system ATP-binding protein
MIGGSYGGQVQFAVAGIDPRVDTIIPIITWSDLSYSLAPNNTSFEHGVSYLTPGTEKQQWTSLFFGLGIADGIQGASADPLRNFGCPNFDNRACGAKAQLDATGAPNDATLLFVRHASVESFVNKIRIPTLLAQGQSDTLFNLQEAITTYRSLRSQKVPVKMIWREGGHSGPGAPGEMDSDANGNLKAPAHNFETRTYLQWFDHYLGGNPRGPRLDVSYFRDWIKYTGDATQAYARASSYPFAATRKLFLSGSDSLVNSASKVIGGSAAFSANSGPASSYTETSALDQSQPVRDGPGTFAQFAGLPLRANLDVIGVPTADVRISAPAHENLASAGGAPSLLVLFFKLYELKPSGQIVLAHRLIAPVRIADFTHPVHVQLPGIVHRFTKGSRIALTISSSDLAYKGNNVSGPVTILTSKAAPGILRLPVVAASDQKQVTPGTVGPGGGTGSPGGGTGSPGGDGQGEDGPTVRR